jgi:UDP-N-acetylmuramoylalanine--D-glutamate ligase
MTTPTILILGGKDKGNDYSRIAALVKEKVKAIVAMGVNNAPIIEFFNNDKFNIPFFDTHSLDEALLTCRKEACPGDTVLLSPACASFDLFHSYEDRGDQFKAWVLNHGGKA